MASVFLAVASLANFALGFGIFETRTRSICGLAGRKVSPVTIPGIYRESYRRRAWIVLGAGSGNDPNDDDTSNDVSISDNSSVPKEGNFDGKGFANYLLPYALALVGSLVATAAMFKFVLLDY